jgi:hypothetical protein
MLASLALMATYAQRPVGHDASVMVGTKKMDDIQKERSPKKHSDAKRGHMSPTGRTTSGSTTQLRDGDNTVHNKHKIPRRIHTRIQREVQTSSAIGPAPTPLVGSAQLEDTKLGDVRDVSMTVGDLHDSLRYAFNPSSGFIEVTRARLPHQLADKQSGHLRVYARYTSIRGMRVIGQTTHGQGWLVVESTGDGLPIGTHITAITIDGEPTAPDAIGPNGERLVGVTQLPIFGGTRMLSDMLGGHTQGGVRFTISRTRSHDLPVDALGGVRIVSAANQQMRGVHIFSGIPETQFDDRGLTRIADVGARLRRFDVLYGVTIKHNGATAKIKLKNRLMRKAVANAGEDNPVRVSLNDILSVADIPFTIAPNDVVALYFSVASSGGTAGGLHVGDVITRINNVKLQPHIAGKHQLDAWLAHSAHIGGIGDEWRNERITLQIASKGANRNDAGQRESQTNLTALEKSVNRWMLSHYDVYPDMAENARVRLRPGDKHTKRSGSNTGTRGAGVAALRRAHGNALLTICASRLNELLPTSGTDTDDNIPMTVRKMMDNNVNDGAMEDMVNANILLAILLTGVLAFDDVRLRPIDVIRRTSIVDHDGCHARTCVYQILLTSVLHNMRTLRTDSLVARLQLVQCIPIFMEKYESSPHAEAGGVPQGAPLTLLSDIRFVLDDSTISVVNLRTHPVYNGLLQTDNELFVQDDTADGYTHKDLSASSATRTDEESLLILRDGFSSPHGASALLGRNRVVWKDVLYDAVHQLLSPMEQPAAGELLAWQHALHRSGLRINPLPGTVKSRLTYHRTTSVRLPDSVNGGFAWSSTPMHDVVVSGDAIGSRQPLVVEVVRKTDIRRTLEHLYCCERPTGSKGGTTEKMKGRGVAVGMGINKLEGYVHSKYWGISRRKIADFLNNKEERQICRKLRAPSTLRHLPTVYRFNDKWQIDSAKMGNTHRWWPTFRNDTNDGHHLSPYRGYVAAIDVFTRFAWIKPVATTTKASNENDSIECFNEAIEWCRNAYGIPETHSEEPKARTLGGVTFRPKTVQSDNGAEFGLAGGKIRTVVDGQMLSTWIFAEYTSSDRRGTLSKFQRVLQDNLVVRYDTVRPAAPQQQAYIEVFNKTFKTILRDMVLAGDTHHRTLRGSPAKQMELMMAACAKYNDSPHSSMPPHLTPHKLARCMMTQGMHGMEPWKTADEVIEFRKTHYIGHAEKKRKSGLSDIDVGAFVRVALGEGRDYFDNDSTWQQQRSARENYTDRQAQKNGLRKALGSNYSTQIYRVVGRRAPHAMSAHHYYIAPITLGDIAPFGILEIPATAPGEHIMKRHIGFYAEQLLLVDIANLEQMNKCSLRGVEGENYGAAGSTCNPTSTSRETQAEDAEHDGDDIAVGVLQAVDSMVRTRSASKTDELKQSLATPSGKSRRRSTRLSSRT